VPVDDLDVRQIHGVNRAPQEGASCFVLLDKREARLWEHRRQHEAGEPETTADVDNPAGAANDRKLEGCRATRQPGSDETVGRRPEGKHTLTRVEDHRRQGSERPGYVTREPVVRDQGLDVRVHVREVINRLS
jgi:hypothetical protein